MKNLVWQQNRHQKVFYKGALQYIVQWGLTFLKFEQTSLFYSHSASYFNLGGGIGALSRRGSSHQRPLMVTGLCGKTSSMLFNAINSEKYLGYAICQAC